MRAIPNRYEIATAQREVALAELEMFRTEIALVMNQPHETIVTWMNEIASKPEDVAVMKEHQNVILRVGMLRPMASHMQQEPSFGRVCVLSVPSQSPEEAANLPALLNQRIVWQRIEDYYGPAIVRDILSAASKPEFYERSLALIPSKDIDTSFFILVREPTVDVISNHTQLRAFAHKTMGNIFGVLKLLETKSEKLAEPMRALLPFAPRLMGVQQRNTDGSMTEPQPARAYGVDVEIVINGVQGNHLVDRAYAQAFWDHYIKYVKERPEDKTLAGIYDANEPNKVPELELVQAAAEDTGTDNIDAAVKG